MVTQESFTGYTNAGEEVNNSNSYEPIQRIPAGMFTIVGDEIEKKYMICIGAYKLTERNLSLEEAHIKIQNKDYDLLIALCSVVAESVYRDIMSEQKVTGSNINS